MDPTNSLPKWIRWLALVMLVLVLTGTFFAGVAFAQERYQPSIRVDHARMFREIMALRQQGRIAESNAKLDQYGVEMGNMAGALGVGLPLGTPPPPIGECEAVPNPGSNVRIPLPNFAGPKCFRLVIDAGPKANAGYASIYEFGGEPLLRQCTLSRVPGDFRPIDVTGSNGPYDAGQGVQCSMIFNPPPGTYFFNVRTTAGASSARVEVSWPR